MRDSIILLKNTTGEIIKELRSTFNLRINYFFLSNLTDIITTVGSHCGINEIEKRLL